MREIVRYVTKRTLLPAVHVRTHERIRTSRPATTNPIKIIQSPAPRQSNTFTNPVMKSTAMRTQNTTMIVHNKVAEKKKKKKKKKKQQQKKKSVR